MKRTTWVVIAGLLALGLPAFVVAEHTACIGGSASAAQTSLTDVHVASTLSSLAATGCNGAPSFVSGAYDCPDGVGFEAVVGAYCGPPVGLGASVLCHWVPVLNTVPTKLYVGFDWSGDRKLSSPNEYVWGPMEPNQYYTITNTGALGKMIAFPTNVLNEETRSADESIVGCMLL